MSQPAELLDQAFTALMTYAAGSGRGALVPLDEAVRASLSQPARRAALEQRLLAILSEAIPSEAKTFICHKLRLIGSAAAVPPLATLLTDPEMGDTARGTLELLPFAEAGNALRLALSQTKGVSRLGVVDALGRRGDPENLAVLEPELNHRDQATAEAAATAIGRLGTPEAASVLRRCLRNLPDALRLTAAHAALDCASRLRRAGHTEAAAALCRMLAGSEWPPIIVRAARHSMDQDRDGA